MINRALVGVPFALLLILAGSTRGQDSPTPESKPSPVTHTVRISFLPPPLDGTISLGIYDSKGKLVRVLQREADINEFTIGTDALSTTWDGKDDAGENVPPGKYNAHGFVVGELRIEPVGYFFNDFVTNRESPRVRHIRHVRLHDDELRLEVELAGNQQATLACDPKNGGILRQLLWENEYHCEVPEALPQLGQPIDCDTGIDATLWLIDKHEEGARREIRQLSKTHELMRRLAIAEDAPQPLSIAASRTEDRIFLVEGDSHSAVSRLRSLSPAESGTGGIEGALSDWKTDFEKKIVEHHDFFIENGKLLPANPNNKSILEKIPVKLAANPLLADARVTVELAVGLDADGSFLKAVDGLPLYTISETPGLVRTLPAARGSGAIDVFQDDGAVVEQLKVTGVEQMMSFDCGTFVLK